MVIREHATRHQRRDDIDACHLCELSQNFGGSRFQHATTDVQHRTFGRKNHACGFFDHSRVTLHRRAIPRKRARHLIVGRPMPCHLVLKNVFREVEQHWPRAARRRKVERLANGERNVIGCHDKFVVLRA